MPVFPIKLSAKAVAGVQKQVDRTNENTGQTLTVQQWITLHLRELAITEELTTAFTEIQEKEKRSAERRIENAVKKRSDELLSDLGEG